MASTKSGTNAVRTAIQQPVIEGGAEGMLRTAAEALQPTHGMAPALTRSRGRAGAGQLLQMWMREIQTCGHRNYDEASGVK